MTRVALVTGGQQGIGLGVAAALVGAGFSVALAAEVAPETPAVGAALAALGEAARYFRHDLRDVAAAPELLDRIAAEMGPVSCLVSNAGVPSPARGDMLDATPENFDFVLSVNLRGGFFLAQAAARRMLALPAAPYRSIVFITSVSAGMVSVERADYCVSKAGAAMMARLFAARLAAEGIGVFDLRPGIIATPMTAGVRDRHSARIADGLVPAGRWGEPSDIGAAILPLVRGDMAFATGAVIPVDGGLSIARL
ncbi:3-ketoacyl-ACP reductase [uncultured Amaricoccus sp.]|uniref:3-ketoacyl-ACP reductase n=1 Tax=uncultured Amaricoccus sp. TaxID=339341 RepID=UPI002637F3A8|nr:3-ketoacyl-ACP reductase [uncultured Amaricoccus sp.]